MSKERELLERALEALHDAKGEIADWGAYASEYFQEKWHLEMCITANDPLIEEIQTYLATEPEMQVYAHYDASGNRTSDPDKIQSTLLVKK